MFIYEIRQGPYMPYVEISDLYLSEPIGLVKSDVIKAIQNVKDEREHYGTEEAYQRMLKVYQDALVAFGENE